MASGFKVASAYVSVVADDTGLRESMAAKIKAAAEGLEAKVRIEAQDDGLREEVAAKVKEASEGEEVKARVGLDDDGLREHLRALLDMAGAGEKVTVKVDVDDGGAVSKLTAVKAAADSAGASASGSGGGFLGLSGGMLFAAGAAVALAPALAALPALLGGLGLGGVAAFGALKDVVGALSAANTSAAATGQSAAQAAQTAYSNAVAIRNAEQAIQDAKRQSAIAAQNSADSIVAANQQVQQSEQAEAQAAQALAQAKIDAANQIADLNNSAADAANGVQDAQLSVQQAQQNLTSVMANSLSTDLQKKQAQQALIDAEQALTDAKQRSKEATEASTKADQEGVNNFPPVVQAQRAYEQAVLATANAQHALVVAERNAADQRISSAESVQKAEQSLTDTLKQQQLAAAAAAASGASGANAYAQAMAKLTPVGQEIVVMLRSMTDGFTAASQNAFLPGVLSFLKDIQPLIPQVIGLVSQAGRAFGGFVAQVGALFTQKAFASDFFTILQQGVGLLQTIGGGIIQMIQGVTTAAAGAGPIVTAVGKGIADLLAAIGPLLQGLVSGGTGAAETIQSILDLVAGLLGPLGDLVGAISGALGPALKVLVPVVLKLVDAFVKALLPSLPQLSTALLAVANILLQLLPSVLPLIDYLGTGLAGALTVVSDLFQGLNTFVQDNIGWLGPLTELILGVIGAMRIWAIVQGAVNVVMAMNPIGLLITAILALVAGVVYAYDHFKVFHDFIDRMWKDFQAWFLDGWHFIDGVWQGIVSGADAMARFIEGLPGRLGRLGGELWGWITTGLKDEANAAIFLVNGMIDSLNALLHGLSDAWSWAGIPSIPSVPHIPYLAKGGTATESGVAVVGDAGPELMYMPKGATVVPLSAGQGGGAPSAGNTYNLTVNIPMTGFADFTNPNAMTAVARQQAIHIRDALKQVEAQYA